MHPGGPACRSAPTRQPRFDTPGHSVRVLHGVDGEGRPREERAANVARNSMLACKVTTMSSL